jgi:hypothetical protein
VYLGSVKKPLGLHHQRSLFMLSDTQHDSTEPLRKRRKPWPKKSNGTTTATAELPARESPSFWGHTIWKPKKQYQRAESYKQMTRLKY